MEKKDYNKIGYQYKSEGNNGQKNVMETEYYLKIQMVEASRENLSDS